jgi:2-hydroxy-6-oxonona-2,4-dienedioate hydrolase
VTSREAHRRGGLLRRWTRVGGHRLHSLETPAAAALGTSGVILLHGAVVTSRYFRPLLHVLAARDRTLPAAAVELPGIGRSSRGGEPRDIGGQAETVAAWLRSTGREPVILVGNSMGAQTAVEVAVRHPELVQALVLIGPTVDAAARTPVAQLGKLLVDGTVETPTQVAITLTDLALSSPRAMFRYLRASLEHPIEERLRDVRAPVLLVRGERDPLAPRRWVQQLLRSASDGRIAEIADGAHTCHERRPDEVAELIDRMRSRS